MKSKYLVNAKAMLASAKNNNFAIPQININNLEWIQASLSAAKIARSPIILGVSMGAAKYMGGYKTVYNMVNDLMLEMEIDIPVCLHLDHGNYDSAILALDSGFTSIMFDGSKLPFNENLELTKKLLKLCNEKNATIEVEVGSIGGYEDNIQADGELANLNECKEIDKLGIDFLAAGIGNIHGLYPDNWKGLNFSLLEDISNSINSGLVLHGGSGIPDEQIKKSIALGVRKINVNTECQIAFSNAVKKYFINNENLNLNNSYDPRKYLKLGKEAIIKTCLAKMLLFESTNRF